MSNPTTPFSWQMPTATDLVTDLPADFEVFGQAVATSMADLLGGTSGQILAKNSNTDMDFIWVANDVGDITAVTAGTGISGGGTSGAVTITNSMATEITAKADLIVGTGNATFDNLPVGANGTVLTADSTVSPTGLKWATVSTSPTFVGCALYMDVNQSLTNNTVTNLNWGAEEFDTDAFHSTSSNTSRITIPSGKAGKYLFAWSVAYSANATGIRETALRKNGTSISYQDFPVSSNASETNMTATYIANAAVADYFELAGYQNTGGALDVRSGSNRAFFHCTYLGA